MVDVVFDTNVLLASLLNPRGANRHCMRLVLGSPGAFTICYSSQMMEEYRDVLSRPVVTGRGLARPARDLLRLVEEVGEELVPKYIPALVYPDIDDKPFLEAAVYANGVLVTNNLKDFPFLGVSILGPGDFVRWWEER